MENESDLYDAFGNYIGPELDSDDSEDGSGGETEVVADKMQDGGHSVNPGLNGHGSDDMDVLGPGDGMRADPSSAVVLAEDKQYFSTAQEVFGIETEALVEQEDRQPISEPLLPPKRSRVTVLSESSEGAPEPLFDHEYLASVLLPVPALCRNVAVIGNLHHGKTVLCDMLFRASHKMPWSPRTDEPLRYMDSRPDERKMKVSVKTVPATLLLPSLSGKSYGITVLDTPGHSNFMDEAIAAMNLVDGVVLLVDVAEGVGLGTELLLKQAAKLRVDIVLVISKLDRLILELRLPPADAYHKIRHVLEVVNSVVVPLGGKRLSPAKGNVAFAAATEGVCFTLEQISEVYVDGHGGPLSRSEFAKRLWGDAYYDSDKKVFSKTRPSARSERTFVEFVLMPLYKLHTAAVSDDTAVLSSKLARNGVKMAPASLRVDVKCLLRNVVGSSFNFGNVSGLVEMITKFVRSPEAAARRKIESMGIPRVDASQGGGDMAWIAPAQKCSSERSDPMVGYVGKLIQQDKEGGESVEFVSLFRVLSGEVRTSDRVRVLGDGYHCDSNDEEQAGAVVEGIFLAGARYKVEVSRACAGQIVLMRGVDETVFKSATVVSSSHATCTRASILRPLLEMITPGVVKVAVEPIRPAEHPKMVSGLRMCLKSYPGLRSKVEESGEHTLIGSGELYMDCVMRDLRENFAEIEVKVSDPVVPFSETVTDTSALQCHAKSPNKRNKLTMMAEPLEQEVMGALKSGSFVKSVGSMDADETAAALRGLGWDSLAAKSLWSFGPHAGKGPNAILNDVLDPNCRERVCDIRESIVRGFNWAVREGPLTDEPVRGVKFRLLDADLDSESARSGPGQVIPTSRRVVYSSMLVASPRLLEPVYQVEVTCPHSAISAVYTLMQRRRGIAISDGPLAGTGLFCYRGYIPVLDSFGLEADLRGLTDGQAFVVQVFDHWAILPGDPLDRSVELRPLEPAGRRELARECLVKTRRRKGLSDDVSVVQYFDDPLLVELIQDDPELRQIL